MREYVLASPDGSKGTENVIEGWGWDHTVWPEQDWPTAVRPYNALKTRVGSLMLHTAQAAFDVDPVLKGRRIVLQSKDGHALWVSSAVIETTTELPETVDGGIIVLDVNGKPSGTLNFLVARMKLTSLSG